jgi:hypothetical protein
MPPCSGVVLLMTSSTGSFRCCCHDSLSDDKVASRDQTKTKARWGFITNLSLYPLIHRMHVDAVVSLRWAEMKSAGGRF